MSPKTELRPLPTSSIHWLFEAARLEHSFGISLLSRQNPLERGIAHNDVEGEFLGSPCWCVCTRSDRMSRFKTPSFSPCKTPTDAAGRRPPKCQRTSAKRPQGGRRAGAGRPQGCFQAVVTMTFGVIENAAGRGRACRVRGTKSRY